jgi:hypothetical protein
MDSTVRPADGAERCQFLATGWNCMTHSQALRCFSDISEASLHKSNKIYSLVPFFFFEVPAGTGEVTLTFNFIRKRTVLPTVSLKDKDTHKQPQLFPWDVRHSPPTKPQIIQALPRKRSAILLKQAEENYYNLRWRFN